MSDASACDLSRLVGAQTATITRINSDGEPIKAELSRDRLTVVLFVSAPRPILCVTHTMDIDRLADNLPAGLRGRGLFLQSDPAAPDALRLARDLAVLETFTQGRGYPSAPVEFTR